MDLVEQAAYLKIHAGPRVFRTVEVRPDLLVDVADDGRIIGIERIGGPVDMGALTAVLVALPFEGCWP